MHVSAEYQGAALSRLFSAGVLKQLAKDGASSLADDLLSECGFLGQISPEMLLRQFFEEVFSFLSRERRTEYVYKNAIARNILLGTHSLNTSFMLTEFRADDCKADCVVLNGTSHVFEIKSDYDSLERLARQLAAYRKVFDYTRVITSEKLLPKVSEIVENWVGLSVLRARGSIGVVRKPVSMRHAVSPEAAFDSLRRPEYEDIVLRQFGRIPDVPNTRIYRECKALFCQLTPRVAHDEMVRVVKGRGGCLKLREFIDGVPSSLKAAALSCQLTPSDRVALLSVLERPVRECFPSLVQA